MLLEQGPADQRGEVLETAGDRESQRKDWAMGDGVSSRGGSDGQVNFSVAPSMMETSSPMVPRSNSNLTFFMLLEQGPADQRGGVGQATADDGYIGSDGQASFSVAPSIMETSDMTFFMLLEQDLRHDILHAA
jgi:hypothetical protein